MKQPALFLDYIERCFDRLQESLAQYHKSGQVKSLFRFRVSIKKIRTCIACLEHYHGKKPFRHYRKEFKKIFRSGGCLRELHLYRDWFRSNGLLRLSRMIQLDTQISRHEKDFGRRKQQAEILVQDARKEILSHALDLNQDKIFDFYVEMLQERLPLMSRKTNARQWHKMRKEFKRILYARHWQEKEGLALLSKRQAIFLDRLQHLVGYWHDNEAMIQWIKLQERMYGKLVPGDQKQLFRERLNKAYQILHQKGQYFHDRVIESLEQCIVIMRPLTRRLKKV